MVRAVAVLVLLLVSTTVSLVCSVLTVALIRSSKRWNGYVLIVYWMSLCQATFDISYYLLAMIYTTNSQGVAQWLIPLYLLTNIVGGLSTALWTCVIATITAFVVFTMQSFNIYKNFTVLCLLTTVPPLAIAIGQIALAFSPQGTNGKADVELMWGYYWLRIACIAYNFVACCLCIAVSSGAWRCGGGRWALGAADEQTQVQEEHPGRSINRRSSPLSATTPAAGKQSAIRTLSQQMLLYPLAQTVTRFGAAWYELVYGFSAPSLNDFSNMPPAQSVAACFWAVLSPAAGTAYFAVYLVMQPVARKKLASWIDKLRCWGMCFSDDSGAGIFVGGEGERDDIREELLASHPDENTGADEENSFGGGRLSSGLLWSRGAATSQVVTINLSDQEQIEPHT